jgi:hypothetical protein
VEFRWLEWGFEGRAVDDPWGDGRWHVAADETPEALFTALRAQAEHTTAVVRGSPLDRIGRPGQRWDGAQPPTLERILQLAAGQTGE